MNKRYYEHTLSTTREFIEYLPLDYDPKLRKENISVVYKWGEPPYKTNGDIQPILLTEKLVLQCGFN